MHSKPLERRKARTALVVVGLALAGATTLSAATAQAQDAQVSPTRAAAGALASNPGTTYQSSDGWCHYNNWGGSFYCNSQYNHTLPNSYHQVFVIGTNKQVYTRWESASGVSDWASLGGQCVSPGHHSVDMWEQNGWTFTIACVGTDNWGYLNTRNSNGTWSGWKGPYDLTWN
ncbi:hypothetical protein [Streptomyces sp. NPDC059819]|uniref:hypothetical protein n=1 Tax=Streptomyces sp. NPDC059819 TaxID=3346963 RepID=UPI0036547651